jgi:uroporphyrinogen-III synthase
LRILVTRPSPQAEHLATLIEQAGGTAVRFPTVEIAGPPDPEALARLLDRLDEFDLAIFISPTAVQQALPLIHTRRPRLPEKWNVAGVGAGSARELGHFGVTRVIAPRERFDSEALLELPELRQVTGKKIVIFRGAGGRELLGDTLRARGAQVEYAECYRRRAPAGNVTPLRQRLVRGEIDIVSITSVEGLRNLCDMAGPGGRDRLLDTPIVVVSARQAAVCRELGFRGPVLTAREASDEAVVSAIRTWRAAQNSL